MITLSRRVEKSIETGKNVQGWKARSEVCDKEMRKQKKNNQEIEVKPLGEREEMSEKDGIRKRKCKASDIFPPGTRMKTQEI